MTGLTDCTLFGPACRSIAFREERIRARLCFAAPFGLEPSPLSLTADAGSSNRGNRREFRSGGRRDLEDIEDPSQLP
jgi:hypothetical protein